MAKLDKNNSPFKSKDHLYRFAKLYIKSDIECRYKEGRINNLTRTLMLNALN